jgi:uncharacterized protein (UPF0332 family)
MVEKSIRSINAARIHFQRGDYDFALSRAYYAVFYLIEAVLLTSNLVFSSHGNVIGTFNKNYVKTGIFPKEFSKVIATLFRKRQIADYEFNIKIDKNETEENLNQAEKLMQALIEHLVKGNFIDSVDFKNKI